MEEKKVRRVESTTLEKVSPEEKKSWLSIAFIWAGNVICVPALMVGGMVAAGLTFKDSVIAMLVGYAIVVAYMALMGAQAAQVGVPSTVSISRAFGDRGSGVAISLIIAISMTGWFGFQTFVCANSFCTIMNTYLGVNFPIWLASILWGGVMLITAVFGIGIIKFLNIVSVPALFLFLIYGVASIMGKPGSGAALANYAPANPTPMLVGITISVGGFAVGAIIAGDYTRYCKSGKEAGLACIIGVIPAGVGALVCGGVLAIVSGSYDITAMFANIGMPIAGMIVLILATWTTNTGNAYSAGIAIVNIFKLKDDKRSMMTIIVGIIGIILAISGIINIFVAFLSFLSALIPPVAGVAIADYWILGKGKAELWKPMPGVNWIGIIAWICGVVVAYFITGFFIPTINGIIVSAIVYIILMSIVKDPKYNPFTALKEEK